MAEVTAAENMARELPPDPADDPPARLSAAKRFQLTLMRDKKAYFGLIVLVIFTVAAVFAAYVAPYDPNAMDYEFMLPPSLVHPLGTDDLGRDLL